MKASIPIKDIMSRDLITADPNDTLDKLQKRMADNMIHHIPVVENGTVTGMVSLNDINRLAHPFTQFNNPEAAASNEQLFSTMLAKEIMTNPVVKVRENDAVSSAVDIFLENVFHALPVVNEKDQLVGMLSTLDIIRHSIDR